MTRDVAAELRARAEKARVRRSRIAARTGRADYQEGKADALDEAASLVEALHSPEAVVDNVARADWDPALYPEALRSPARDDLTARALEAADGLAILLGCILADGFVEPKLIDEHRSDLSRYRSTRAALARATQEPEENR